MISMRTFSVAAAALSACLLAPVGSAQTSGVGGAQQTPPASVLQPAAPAGKVIGTLSEAQIANVEVGSDPYLDREPKWGRIVCADIDVSVDERTIVRTGEDTAHRAVRIRCGEVYDRPRNGVGSPTLRPGGEVYFSYMFLQSDPASLSLAEMYLSMAQDAMRLDRSLQIEHLDCDQRFGPYACWNQIRSLTLYNDRRTDAD